MFRILIIDDNENQYENVKSYLLQTQNCNKELKEKILKDFIQIEYIKSPTEAEEGTEKVQILLNFVKN